jgi:hypothetical protein
VCMTDRRPAAGLLARRVTGVVVSPSSTFTRTRTSTWRTIHLAIVGALFVSSATSLKVVTLILRAMQGDDLDTRSEYVELSRSSEDGF